MMELPEKIRMGITAKCLEVSLKGGGAQAERVAEYTARLAAEDSCEAIVAEMSNAADGVAERNVNAGMLRATDIIRQRYDIDEPTEEPTDEPCERCGGRGKVLGDTAQDAHGGVYWLSKPCPKCGGKEGVK